MKTKLTALWVLVLCVCTGLTQIGKLNSEGEKYKLALNSLVLTYGEKQKEYDSKKTSSWYQWKVTDVEKYPYWCAGKLILITSSDIIIVDDQNTTVARYFDKAKNEHIKISVVTWISGKEATNEKIFSMHSFKSEKGSPWTEEAQPVVTKVKVNKTNSYFCCE